MVCKRKNVGWAIKEMFKQMGIALCSGFVFLAPGIVLGLLFGDVAWHIYLVVALVALLCLVVYGLCDIKSRE